MQREWLGLVEQEGTLEQISEGRSGEPRCPACGFQGPLVDGACGDCGLQLG